MSAPVEASNPSVPAVPVVPSTREEFLRGIPVFKALAADDLSALAQRLQPREVAAGEIVFREGDVGHATLFLIEQGSIRITRGKDKATVELARLMPGTYFGELALFDNAPRSAAAIACERSVLLALPRESFFDFIKRDPDAAIAIMAELGARIRHTNDLVAKATEDMQKMGGMEALDAPYNQVTFWAMVKKRGGWLSALFLGEMLTATAMGHYEEEIARAVVLALFVPLIISTGGNSGSQGTSLIIRALAMREMRLRDWFKVFKREILSGIVLGAMLGLIGAVRIEAWQTIGWADYGVHHLAVAATVWASLVGVVTFGTVAGSMLPFLLRRLGFDPATSSAPFVATLVDVSGLIIYFTCASIILRGILL